MIGAKLLAASSRLGGKTLFIAKSSLNSAAAARQSWAGRHSLTHVRQVRLSTTSSAQQPKPSTSDHIMRFLDYSGTVSFAVTGSIAALTAGMDVLGCTIVGSITALGGGTIRDAIIGRTAFWMIETEYLWMCLASTAAGFWGWKEYVVKGSESDKVKGQETLDGFAMMLWDALGVGAFAVIGAKSGVRAGFAPVICLITGMMTATFGGVTRDVLTGRPPRILHSEADAYALPALGGAATYLAFSSFGAGQLTRNLLGVAAGTGLRTVSWLRDVRLPTGESDGRC